MPKPREDVNAVIESLYRSMAEAVERGGAIPFRVLGPDDEEDLWQLEDGLHKAFSRFVNQGD